MDHPNESVQLLDAAFRAWVALAGDPQHKYQQELLLAADTSVTSWM